jgi:plasmid replication initiation protein
MNYINQSTTLAYSCYKMSLLTRKVVFLLAAIVNVDNNNYMSEIYFPDLCRQLNISLTDTRQKKNLLKGLQELTHSVVTFGEAKSTFSKDFTFCNWIQTIDFNAKTRKLSVMWNSEIGALFINNKKKFEKLAIDTIMSFKSFYALRLYELCLSKIGFSGRNGNQQNNWFLQLDFSEINNYIFNNSKVVFAEKIRQLKKAIAEVNKKAEFTCALLPPSNKARYRQDEIFTFMCEKNIEKILAKKQQPKPRPARSQDDIEKKFQAAVKIPAVFECYTTLLKTVKNETQRKIQVLRNFGFI